MKRLLALAIAAILTINIHAAATVDADAIYTPDCHISRSARLVTSTCPSRWNGSGPDLFRARTMCLNAAGYGYGPLYGPFRSGGNYVPSSVSCPTSYPTPYNYYIDFYP